jgi:uncharacterized RDD family membrane protein YckC
MDERHYRPRVILPRRIKADLVDGAIAAALLFGPLLVGQGLTGVLPDSVLRLFVLGIPAGIGYSLFRDSAGRGTSLGKRALGLRLIRLEDGKPCAPGQVWARNLLDPIPVIGLADFVWMCVDKHGQKLMDRKLRTQVVEISDLDAGVASVDPAPPSRPAQPARYLASRGRRVAVILVYWAFSFLVVALTAMMALLASCLEADQCSSREEEMVGILAAAWMALLVGIGVAGWFGRLWGARGRRA